MKNHLRIIAPVVVASGALLLAACSPVGVAVGAGAAVGVAASQEGGIGEAASDTGIRVQILDAWFRHDIDMYRKLGMTVREGRVLVTGTLPSADQRVEAIRLVWQIDGVKQVINEIRVDEQGATVGSYVQDTWITGNVKTLLMFDKEVQSINYTVETVGGTVFIMGVGQNQYELDRVINHARNTKYVKNVVSYARLRGEAKTGLATPSSAPVAAPQDNMQPVQIAPVDAPVSIPAVESEPVGGGY